MNNKNANQLYDHCNSNSNWVPVNLNSCQQLANEGHFVMASWKNPDPTESGHIAVIVPGAVKYSGNWGGYVPQTFDTGAGHKWECEPLSDGFGSAKKPSMKYLSILEI